MNIGIAVGGYYAGIRLSHAAEYYKMALPMNDEIPTGFDSPGPVDTQIAVDEYRFIRLFQVDGGDLFNYGMWLHTSVKNYADAWQIVCDGYAAHAKKARK